MKLPTNSTGRHGWPGEGKAAIADLCIFVAATLGSYVAQSYERPISAALIYLVGITLIGARSGLVWGLAAAITGSAIYNFLFSEPVFHFSASSADEFIPLIAFNLSAILSGGMAGRLKDSVNLARAAEAKNAHLLSLSDDLQSAIRVADVLQIARRGLPFQKISDIELFVYVGGELFSADDLDTAVEVTGVLSDESIATLDGKTSCTLALNGSAGVIGFVRFAFDRKSRNQVELAVLQGIATILGLAVDRCLLLERLSESEAVQRSEELKTAILSSVSHDLRTPLTAIEAAATSLRSFDSSLSARDRETMLATISEQCRKLNRYTANLLDMGRIQAGIPAFMFTEVDIIEILGVVLASMRESHPQHTIEKRIELEAGVVLANPAMLEQVIRNLIENAIVHGASRRPTAIALRQDGDYCMLEVTDCGPGITADEQPLVFNKFYRSRAALHRDGNGLGLHIANGFTEAFGGSLSILSPHEGGVGTRVSLRLPLSAAHLNRVMAWE